MKPPEYIPQQEIIGYLPPARPTIIFKDAEPIQNICSTLEAKERDVAEQNRYLLQLHEHLTKALFSGEINSLRSILPDDEAEEIMQTITRFRLSLGLKPDETIHLPNATRLSNHSKLGSIWKTFIHSGKKAEKLSSEQFLYYKSILETFHTLVESLSIYSLSGLITQEASALRDRQTDLYINSLQYGNILLRDRVRLYQDALTSKLPQKPAYQALVLEKEIGYKLYDDVEEKRHARVFDFLQNLKTQGKLNQWIAKFANDNAQEVVFTPETIAKYNLKLIWMEFEEVNKIIGKEIGRPGFIFQNFVDLHEFYAKSLKRNEVPNGFCLSLKYTDKYCYIWDRLPIFFATKDGTATIQHEFRHSADPFFTKREKLDNSILSEIFAYFPDSQHYSANFYEALRNTLQTYYYKPSFGIPQPEYARLVDDAIQAFYQLATTCGKIVAQRVLITSKTTQEFLSRAKQRINEA